MFFSWQQWTRYHVQIVTATALHVVTVHDPERLCMYMYVWSTLRLPPMGCQCNDVMYYVCVRLRLNDIRSINVYGKDRMFIGLVTVSVLDGKCLMYVSKNVSQTLTLVCLETIANKVACFCFQCLRVNGFCVLRKCMLLLIFADLFSISCPLRCVV